jgi:hypothetical protein
MERDAHTVAEEIISLVINIGDDAARCNQVALALERIYDHAYALGYANGVRQVEACHGGPLDAPANGNATLNTAAAQASAQKAPVVLPTGGGEPYRPKRRLYGAPCSNCGTLHYTDETCPTCAYRERTRSAANATAC